MYNIMMAKYESKQYNFKITDKMVRIWHFMTGASCPRDEAIIYLLKIICSILKYS